jgi:hypothetical protein
MVSAGTAHAELVTAPAARSNPRVAYFPDSFDETNGAARTSRALLQTAARRGVRSCGFA